MYKIEVENVVEGKTSESEILQEIVKTYGNENLFEEDEKSLDYAIRETTNRTLNAVNMVLIDFGISTETGKFHADVVGTYFQDGDVNEGEDSILNTSIGKRLVEVAKMLFDKQGTTYSRFVVRNDYPGAYFLIQD